MKDRERILVAGIGNIFLGDDAFGSEVARRLAQRSCSPLVRVVDFGISALDLVYALLDGYDAVILVDATSRGGEPGTIYVIEPDLMELGHVIPAMETHAMDPLRVLALARLMGADLRNIRIIGCEPETLGPENEGMLGLGPRVAAAIDPAIEAIQLQIEERLTELFAK